MRELLICFDVDGTLIDDTVFIWQTLHDKILTDPEEREHWTREYWAGRISYAQWAQKDVDMWIDKKVTRSRMMELIDELSPMKGSHQVLEHLHAAGHTLGVISGSLDIAIARAFPRHLHLFHEIYLNTLIFDEHDYLAGVIPTPFDIEHKATGLCQMAKETGIPLSDTVFIGDNFNDIEVARIAGCSIAFNCKSDELAQISTHLIQGKDLALVLPIIESFSLCQNAPNEVKS